MGRIQIVPNHGSYKIGMNEVVGLREALVETFKPVRDALRESAYWDRELEFEDAEYKSRDGFIPHSHNCGGLMLCMHVPYCEKYEFEYLSWNECDECGDAEKYPDGGHRCGFEGIECGYESDGQLDAYIRIWFKFEGINEDGELEFYINASGGNEDAPYFRVKHLPDLFEASFTCKSVKGIKRAASKPIKALVALIHGGAK